MTIKLILARLGRSRAIKDICGNLRHAPANGTSATGRRLNDSLIKLASAHELRKRISSHFQKEGIIIYEVDPSCRRI